MRTSHILSAIVLGSGLIAGGATIAPAMAQSAATQSSAQAQAELTLGQVYDKLVAQGFRDIDEIERERDRFEVKATNAEGKRVKLEVDAKSGEILDTRSKSDKRDRASGDTDRRATRDGGVN